MCVSAHGIYPVNDIRIPITLLIVKKMLRKFLNPSGGPKLNANLHIKYCLSTEIYFGIVYFETPPLEEVHSAHMDR